MRETHVEGTIVETGCEHAVGSVPDVVLVPALVSGRADLGAVRIEPAWVRGVAAGRGRDRDIGDFSSLDGGGEGVGPSLGEGVDIDLVRVRVCPFYGGEAQEGKTMGGAVTRLGKGKNES